MIGMIFECGPEGADKKVCEWLAARIVPGAKLLCRTLDNKPNLIRDAGVTAKQLLADGCSCVLIIWDLRPTWPDKKSKPCRAAECNAILESLQQAGVAPGPPVYLVCIEQELESWLLACDHAVSAVLSTPAHAFSIPRTKRPDQVPNPKALMVKHFKTARNWTYDDKVDALRTLNAAPLDLTRLGRSISFKRFHQKLQQCTCRSNAK